MKEKNSEAEILVSQSYVFDGSNEYTIKYYLVYASDSLAPVKYGIKITTTKENKEDYEVKYLDKDESNVMQLILLYAANFVFPSSLNDLVEDYVYCQK